MNLVVVESPTKARKLSQYLGKDFRVEASMGHVRDLPKSKMGVDIDHDFEPVYEVTEGRQALITKLKKMAATSDKVYLATDPDREGEAISWHLKFLLQGKPDAKSKPETKFVRSTFHEITKDAVLEAIAHPSHINEHLVDAQQARRVLDRIVGYYLSPVLWKKVRRGLSAGRVQSVALRLIVEREKEIQAFQAKEFWEVDAHLKALQGPLTARVVEWNGKAYQPVKKEEVDPVESFLKQAVYKVKQIERTERRRQSLPPFTTSTLQQAAANRLGWSAKSTMRVAQELYEEGFITYHRTDSVALSAQAIDMARAYIPQEFGQQYLPTQARVFKSSSKNAQEAHEAIRPTDIRLLSTSGKIGDEKHAKLYALIWKRFLASQMEVAVYDQTAIHISADVGVQQAMLRASGSVIRFDGWMKLFPSTSEEMLPAVEESETLEFLEALTVQKFTQPPARYNDASLVKSLEKLGIGRPSTYASIISVLEARGYVERKDKAFVPTAIGDTVATFLVENFPKELDYKFTADMEDDLDAISRGEKKWRAVMKSFFKEFEEKVNEVTKDAARAKVPVEETGEACPDCTEGKLVIRSGRFGKFISCSRYPECKYTAKLVEKVEGVKCPECIEGDIVYKRTKRGRGFYGCSRYPKCTYATWNKPVPGQPMPPRTEFKPKVASTEGDVKTGKARGSRKKTVPANAKKAAPKKPKSSAVKK